MFLVVPTGRRYTATIKGEIPRLVECDRCANHYAYLVKLFATGQGSSPLWLNNEGAKARAEAAARAAFEKQAQRRTNAVRCPHCGVYQRSMLWQARWSRSVWLFVAWGVLAAATGIWLLNEPRPPVAGLVGAIVLIVALMAAHLWVYVGWDLNALPDGRIEKARADPRLLTAAQIDDIIRRFEPDPEGAPTTA